VAIEVKSFEGFAEKAFPAAVSLNSQPKA